MCLNVTNHHIYPTKYCPKNQTEWNERATAINCSDSRKYMCLPNENFTELFEICNQLYSINIRKGKTEMK